MGHGRAGDHPGAWPTSAPRSSRVESATRIDPARTMAPYLDGIVDARAVGPVLHHERRETGPLPRPRTARIA